MADPLMALAISKSTTASIPRLTSLDDVFPQMYMSTIVNFSALVRMGRLTGNLAASPKHYFEGIQMINGPQWHSSLATSIVLSIFSLATGLASAQSEPAPLLNDESQPTLKTAPMADDVDLNREKNGGPIEYQVLVYRCAKSVIDAGMREWLNEPQTNGWAIAESLRGKSEQVQGILTELASESKIELLENQVAAANPAGNECIDFKVQLPSKSTDSTRPSVDTADKAGCSIRIAITPRWSQGDVLSFVDVQRSSEVDDQNGTIIGLDGDGNPIRSQPINQTWLQSTLQCSPGQSMLVGFEIPGKSHESGDEISVVMITPVAVESDK